MLKHWSFVFFALSHWYNIYSNIKLPTYTCPRDFYLPKFQDIVQLKFGKSWKSPNFRTISVSIDVHFICLWDTWGQHKIYCISINISLRFVLLSHWLCHCLICSGSTPWHCRKGWYRLIYSYLITNVFSSLAVNACPHIAFYLSRWKST